MRFCNWAARLGREAVAAAACAGTKLSALKSGRSARDGCNNCLRKKRKKNERGEQRQVHRALHHGRAAAAQRQDRNDECQYE